MKMKMKTFFKLFFCFLFSTRTVRWPFWTVRCAHSVFVIRCAFWRSSVCVIRFSAAAFRFPLIPHFAFGVILYKSYHQYLWKHFTIMNYFIFLIEINLKIEIQTIIVKVIIFVSFSVSNEENYKETHEWNYQLNS